MWIISRFQGPSAPVKAQPVFEAYALDIINLSRQSFTQRRSRRREKFLKGFQGPSALAKPCWDLRLMLLILSIYLDIVSVKENL